MEPGDELETAQLRRTSRHVDGEEEGMDHLLPLPEGVLTRNLGLDIVVVVTKAWRDSHSISPPDETVIDSVSIFFYRRTTWPR